MKRRRRALVRSGVLAVTLFGALLGSAANGVVAQDKQSRSAAELMDAVMWGKEPIGGPFTLIDHTGKTRTEADFRGKLLLVYFGFTYCPDICPTDLQAMNAGIEKLGPAGDIVQPLFVTVDPERDTAAHLAQYVGLFHSRLIGLTGNTEQVRRAADAYRVHYVRVAFGANYTIDHSAFIYLMGRDGAYLGFFPPGTSPDQIATVVRPHLTAPLRR